MRLVGRRVGAEAMGGRVALQLGTQSNLGGSTTQRAGQAGPDQARGHVVGTHQHRPLLVGEVEQGPKGQVRPYCHEGRGGMPGPAAGE